MIREALFPQPWIEEPEDPIYEINPCVTKSITDYPKEILPYTAAAMRCAVRSNRRKIKGGKKMNNQLSAICSYCEEYATFRIGNNDYELHSCPPHEETAIHEFNLVYGVDSWRMETQSNLGFPKPKEIKNEQV